MKYTVTGISEELNFPLVYTVKTDLLYYPINLHMTNLHLIMLFLFLSAEEKNYEGKTADPQPEVCCV